MSSRASSSGCVSKGSKSYSSGKSSSRHRRNVRLEEQNNHYRRNHLPFTIPSSFYNVVHVHRFTTIDKISTLINHFESCYRYSIDTESDRFTNELALIQVHSIPQTLPAFVILFEINHFPPADTILFEKIKLLFCVLFRLGNIIFSWGSMVDELKFAIQMNLFTWPSFKIFVNLQDEFSNWYYAAQPSCKACSPIQSSTLITSSKCSCISSNISPYVNWTDKWSLQHAISYTVHRFIDKSSTRKNWSILLDPKYSPLSSNEQNERIHYAIYDCFAVTLLHQAIYEKWSLIKLREAELITLFTSNASPSSSLSSLENISKKENQIKSISLVNSNASRKSSSRLPNLFEDNSEDDSDDDEIFVSFLSRPHDASASTTIHPNRHIEVHPVASSDGDIIELTSTARPLLTKEPPPPPPPRRNCRSTIAKTRRNRKRNMVHRSRRDQHIIARNVYYRFNVRQIKHILRASDIRYVHLKLDTSSHIVSIGMKKPSLVALYFDRIPDDLFDKEHYQQYRQTEH